MVSFTFIATLGFAAAASVSAGRGDRAHRRAEIEICPTACPPMANNDWRRSTVSYSGSDLFNYEHDGKIGCAYDIPIAMTNGGSSYICEYFQRGGHLASANERGICPPHSVCKTSTISTST